jgi:hypothetical protein
VLVANFAHAAMTFQVHTPALRWHAVEDDTGGFYVIWSEAANSAIALRAQHFGGDGTAAWPDASGDLLVDVVRSTADWTAVSDGHHGLAVVWANSGTLYAQRFSPAGQPVWPQPIFVRVSSAAIQTPAAIADSGGGIFIVWSEKAFGDRSILLAQHVAAQGGLLWNASGARISLRPSDQRRPGVQYDGASGFLVSWADYRDFASDWRVQRMNYQGFRLWGVEGEQITAPAGADGTFLPMAPWRQGTVHFAWSGSEAGHSHVFERWFDPQGNPLPADLRTVPAQGDQWNPVVTGNGAGVSWLGWEDNRNDRTWQVYARSGIVDIPLAPSNADQGRLTLMDDGTGGVFAAWIEARQGPAAIYAQHLDAKGKPLLARSGEGIVKGVKRPTVIQWILLSPGQGFLAWSVPGPTGTWILGGQSVSVAATPLVK